MKKYLLPLFLGVLSSILLFSCVRDTDFDQAEEVSLTPIVELNLIHFNLDAGEFFDDVNGLPRLILTDTTEIRFLDDTETQESLLRADFQFLFTNSIARSFTTDFSFIDEQGNPTYATTADVAVGSLNQPVETEFIEVVEGDQILELTQANRVVVTVTIPSSNANLEGTLNLKSKTTYYLEIQERD